MSAAGATPEIERAKAELRKLMSSRLRELPTEERAERSAVICTRVLELAAWKNATRVLLFAPMRSEPDIASLAIADGKSIVIIPPTTSDESELELPFVPDFVLVPGLAFSPDGWRLGRGGGFYDRLLAGRARNACKVGVCFALQLCEAIPHAAHDVALDAVISD